MDSCAGHDGCRKQWRDIDDLFGTESIERITNGNRIVDDGANHCVSGYHGVRSGPINANDSRNDDDTWYAKQYSRYRDIGCREYGSGYC